MSAPARIVVVGGGPAGRAAIADLPGATLIARPVDTAWHAEPGLLWVESGRRVQATPFDALLVCADEPLLLVALGCAVREGRVLVDERGATSVPGLFAAGRICGAVTPEQAAAQGQAAAVALLAAHVARFAAFPAPPDVAGTDRFDPIEMAALLESSPGRDRNAAALAQSAILGPVSPARPVGLAALAGLVDAPPTARPPQRDDSEGA